MQGWVAQNGLRDARDDVIFCVHHHAEHGGRGTGSGKAVLRPGGGFGGQALRAFSPAISGVQRQASRLPTLNTQAAAPCTRWRKSVRRCERRSRAVLHLHLHWSLPAQLRADRDHCDPVAPIGYPFAIRPPDVLMPLLGRRAALRSNAPCPAGRRHFVPIAPSP